METFLQRGNIIKLKKNMPVFIMAKEKFGRREYPFSDQLIWTCISIGTILKSEITPIEKGRFFIDFKKFLAKQRIFIESDKIENVIESILENPSESLDTSIYEGTYIVTDAAFSKATTDKQGWKVEATKLENDRYIPAGLKVYFFQTPGCIATILPSEISIVDDVLNKLTV